MNLDGFHITDSSGHVGFQASASSIERSTPLVSRGRNAWKYHESIPDEAKHDRYFCLGYEEITHLTQRYSTTEGPSPEVIDIAGWTERETKRRQRVHGWRYRRDNTTKRVEYYLIDLLVTDWAYMLENMHPMVRDLVKLDDYLICNAHEYQESRRASTKISTPGVLADDVARV